MNAKNTLMNLGLDALSLIISVSLALYLGPDINWDLFSYHLYAADYQYFRRVDQDYMGASLQGYLNGVAYLPLYGMFRMGASTETILSVLGALHALNLMAVHRVARALRQADDEGIAESLLFRCGAVVLAAASPLFWVELGSSFSDVLASIPVLFAVYIWLNDTHARHAQRDWRFPTFGVALLLGLAVGLKLTAALWVLPVVFLMFFVNQRGGNPSGFVLLTFAGGVVGFTSVSGWWAVKMWSEHGNPLFPLLNNLFQSPDAPLGIFKHHRFIPDSMQEIMLFPVGMVKLVGGAHSELFALDIRPLAMFALTSLLAVLFVIRYPRGAVFRASTSPGFWLAVLLAVVWFIWLTISGNGRYVMPLWFLLGVSLVWVLWSLTSSLRWRIYGVLMLAVIQLGSNFSGGVERWGAIGPQNKYLSANIPSEWRSTPRLFFSLQNQSLSFLAPQVHSDSGFVNLLGQVPLNFSSSQWGRVEALLNRHGGKVQTLQTVSRGASEDQQNEIDKKAIQVQQANLLPYQMKILLGSCVSFSMWRGGEGEESSFTPLYDRVVSCVAERMSDEELVAIRPFFPVFQAANRLFEEIESACPNVSRGMSATTRYTGDSYFRQYVNTDVTIVVYPVGGVVRASDFYGDTKITGCFKSEQLAKLVLENKKWKSRPENRMPLGGLATH